MYIFCEHCGVQKSRYEEYLLHLLTPGHEERSIRQKGCQWTRKENERTIVVSRSLTSVNLPTTQDSALWLFYDLGFISNFYAHQKCKFILVQFDTKGYADHLLRVEGKSHLCSLLNLPSVDDLCVRRKSDMSDIEWLELLGQTAKAKKLAAVAQNRVALNPFEDPRSSKPPKKEPPQVPQVSGKATSIAQALHMQPSKSASAIRSQQSSKQINKLDLESSRISKSDNDIPVQSTSKAFNKPQIQSSQTSSSSNNVQVQQILARTPDVASISSSKNADTKPTTAKNAPKPSAEKGQTPPKKKLSGKAYIANKRHQDLSAKINAVPLKDQLSCFVKETTLPTEDLLVRREFLNQLAHILRSPYPHCLVYPFGSTITGLGDRDADIDIYLDLYGVTLQPFNSNQNHYTENPPVNESCIKTLANYLRSFKVPLGNGQFVKFCRLVVPIIRTRVPIIRTEHYNGLKCDLSFKNILSVQNSKMIAFYITLDPRIRPLIVLMRYWGRHHDLISGSSIKSYALVLLILVFLTIKRVIPSVQFIQNFRNTPPQFCTGWNSAFCDNKGEVMKAFRKIYPAQDQEQNNLDLTTSVLKLAKEFFEMYAQTDFNSVVICSLMGCFLPKENFRPGNEEGLPRALDLYKSWSANQPLSERLNINRPMCVQDPFDLSFNVCGVAKPHIMLLFQDACDKTAKVIDDVLQGNTEGGLMKIFDAVKLSMVNPMGARYGKIIEEPFLLAPEQLSLRLSISTDFKIIFLRVFLGLESDGIVLKKMRSLWLMFVQNMLMDIFGKSLELCITKKFRISPPKPKKAGGQETEQLAKSASNSSVPSTLSANSVSISAPSNNYKSTSLSAANPLMTYPDTVTSGSDLVEHIIFQYAKAYSSSSNSKVMKKRSRKGAVMITHDSAQMSIVNGSSSSSSNGASPLAKVIKRENESEKNALSPACVKIEPRDNEVNKDKANQSQAGVKVEPNFDLEANLKIEPRDLSFDLKTEPKMDIGETPKRSNVDKKSDKMAESETDSDSDASSSSSDESEDESELSDFEFVSNEEEEDTIEDGTEPFVRNVKSSEYLSYNKLPKFGIYPCKDNPYEQAFKKIQIVKSTNAINYDIQGSSRFFDPVERSRLRAKIKNEMENNSDAVHYPEWIEHCDGIDLSFLENCLVVNPIDVETKLTQEILYKSDEKSNLANVRIQASVTEEFIGDWDAQVMISLHATQKKNRIRFLHEVVAPAIQLCDQVALFRLCKWIKKSDKKLGKKKSKGKKKSRRSRNYNRSMSSAVVKSNSTVRQ